MGAHLINASSHQLQQAPAFWEKRGAAALLLWPLSKCFGFISELRKCLYELGIFKSQSLNVPIIVVGNLRVGGTGKTPTVLAIAQVLHEQGFHPGVISRGYKGQSLEPIEVTETSNPSELGDEPCYMAQQLAQLHIPVFVHSRRIATAQALLKAHPQVNVIISDDGLQHYAMKRWPAREGGRDIELVVRDARAEGNAFLLPAGPLRESSDRPRDYTLNLGSSASSGTPYLTDAPNFYLETIVKDVYQLAHPEHQVDLNYFASQPDILAAAGIGNPKKFFDVLESAGLKITPLALPDHFDFKENPFQHSLAPVVMITEKDAVKCAQLEQYKNDERIWVVPITVKLPNDFVSLMIDVLHRPNPK
jgi:tetraacyldisaccharide 4'-kinase